MCRVTRRYYVGLAATLHDPALAIVDDEGEAIFAEATERYLQCKRAYNCPPDDMTRVAGLVRQHCEAGAEIVACVNWSARYRTALALAVSAPWHDGLPTAVPSEDDPDWPLPHPLALATAQHNSLSQVSVNLRSSPQMRFPVTVRQYDHHLTHAAYAAWSSPFPECSVAVVDGFGEGGSTAFYHFGDGELTRLGDPDAGPETSLTTGSLGSFYGLLCGLCGFDPVLGEEWKVMGLAGYGRFDRRLDELLRPMVEVKGLALVQPLSGDDMLGRRREIRRLVGHPHSPAIERADLAHTGQALFEDLMGELMANLAAADGSAHLALAGGCALNSSCNGKLLARTPFSTLHVPPAPGDDGTALGAALLAFREDHPDRTPNNGGRSPFLGTTIEETTLDDLGRFGFGLKVERDVPDLCERVAGLLTDGKVVGFLQGPAEFGPRALGNRSILADPRHSSMRDRINAEVKFREAFRPLAPAILDEHGDEWFAGYQSSRYMERTLPFRPAAARRVPAVVHVDGTGRLQSVRREWNPRLHRVIECFHGLTGVPIVLNTSCNVMGKPIVHSLQDALGVLLTTGLDALAINDALVQQV